MDFIEYITKWVSAEVLQARIMIGIGVLVLIGFLAILKGGNELLRGSLIPLGLLLLVLVGYGGYILQSRPAHAEESTALYKTSVTEAVEKEKAKHISDNKAGNTLLRIYPILILISVVALIFVKTAFLKGVAAGFILLFLSIYIIDTGFVTRSNAFIAYLDAAN